MSRKYLSPREKGRETIVATTTALEQRLTKEQTNGESERRVGEQSIVEREQMSIDQSSFALAGQTQIDWPAGVCTAAPRFDFDGGIILLSLSYFFLSAGGMLFSPKVQVQLNICLLV